MSVKESKINTVVQYILSEDHEHEDYLANSENPLLIMDNDDHVYAAAIFLSYNGGYKQWTNDYFEEGSLENQIELFEKYPAYLSEDNIQSLLDNLLEELTEKNLPHNVLVEINTAYENNFLSEMICLYKLHKN